MPNIQNLNLLYDSASVLSAGVVSIDLECNATTNKVLSSVIIDKNTFVEVPKVLGSSHIYVTKIVNCDNSYYYVSDSYGVVSDKMTTKCPACEFDANLQVTIDLQPILDKLDVVITNDDENTTNIINALNDNALIEFDITMNVPAETDAEFEITPLGTEIRDYQIFEVSNPLQDITSDVSSAVVGTNKIRLFTTLPLSIKIIGTRTQV